MATASSVQENQKLFILLFVQYPVVPTVVFGKPAGRKCIILRIYFQKPKHTLILCVLGSLELALSWRMSNKAFWEDQPL
jgi:hypothetical protein